MVFYKDLEANQFVIPGSNYHMRMSAQSAARSTFSTTASYETRPVAGRAARSAASSATGAATPTA